MKNWTHRDSIGRFMVEIGVSPASDPTRVRDVMLKAAGDHPLVLSHPEPNVTLAKITETSLVFQLHAYVGDITERRQGGERFALCASSQRSRRTAFRSPRSSAMCAVIEPEAKPA